MEGCVGSRGISDVRRRLYRCTRRIGCTRSEVTQCLTLFMPGIPDHEGDGDDGIRTNEVLSAPWSFLSSQGGNSACDGVTYLKNASVLLEHLFAEGTSGECLPKVGCKGSYQQGFCILEGGANTFTPHLGDLRQTCFCFNRLTLPLVRARPVEFCQKHSMREVR